MSKGSQENDDMVLILILKVVAFVLIFFWLISMAEDAKDTNRQNRTYKDE